MIEISKFGNFKNFDKNKNKRQIVLCETFRNSEDYLNTIKFRNNGNYTKVPNYLITKEGKVIGLLPDDCYSNFFKKNEIDRQSIIICLENLGWLKKLPIEGDYQNWIGGVCNSKPFEKKWRDKMYWDEYTPEQVESLVDLCKKLTKKFSINKTFIGHNTKVDGVQIFNGIVCRSNYNNKYTDPNPSFKFEEFKTSIENE